MNTHWIQKGTGRKFKTDKNGMRIYLSNCMLIFIDFWIWK